MFCDLVGSTALSEKLDPEELREVIQDYQEVCAEVISRYDGHIAKYLGDGILVYFGYPMAHEDDAQRAVHTGLEIIEEIKDLSLRLQKDIDVSLAVRLGIHTGLVVAGEMGGGDVREAMAIVGETPNIAARLEGVAEPDTVVISPATYRLTQGYFECESTGPHQLKGLSQPMDVYRVLKETGVQTRFDIAITKGLTPLVGREHELELLLERWNRVKEGDGQVVLISGEAGIGKSRLLQVLKDRMAQESHTRIVSRCSPYYENSSLYPVIDHLQRLLQFKSNDSSDIKVSKLKEFLEQYGLQKEEMVPLFAKLLSIPIPDSYTQY
jgi:class 3 adenylate cyclase